MDSEDFSNQIKEIKEMLSQDKENYVTDESLNTKLKEFANTLKDESDPPKAENSSKERLLTEAKATEELMEHITSCKDNNCGIHQMKNDFQKNAFMKGILLGKKLHNKGVKN